MAPPNAVTAKLDPTQVAELMQALGACLYQYQQVESCLKILLPHFRQPGSPTVTKQPLYWRELIDSKHTLGPLVEKFKSQTKQTNAKDIDAYLRALVQQRNDVVHHFLTDPLRPIATAAQLDEAIHRLRDYQQFVEPFRRELQRASGLLLDAFNTASPGSTHTITLQFPLPGEGAP